MVGEGRKKKKVDEGGKREKETERWCERGDERDSKIT